MAAKNASRSMRALQRPVIGVCRVVPAEVNSPVLLLLASLR